METRAMEFINQQGPSAVFSILFDATKLTKSLQQYVRKLNAIVGAADGKLVVIYLDVGESPSAALERVKEKLGLAGLYGEEYAMVAKKVLASEILCAILVVQTPAKGSSPFHLLVAKPQTTNVKSDFQATIISMMYRKLGKRFLGPVADGADAKLVSKQSPS